MTSPDPSVFEKAMVIMLTRRAGSGADAAGVATAVRGVYDDLATALSPLISQAGVEALVARALHLAAGEYPSDPAGEEQPAEVLARVSLWVERQDRTAAIDAAAAMFERFAALLAALIGEPLATRYLRKAWPDGSFRTSAEGEQA
jgi:hypothetical protein